MPGHAHAISANAASYNGWLKCYAKCICWIAERDKFTRRLPAGATLPEKLHHDGDPRHRLKPEKKPPAFAIAMSEAMMEATTETYRKLAEEARAEAAVAKSPSSRRLWNEVAAHYEKLAAFVEKPKSRR